MRHRKSGRKLGMDSSARKAMYRNMVTSLMLHGQIRTTEARAKELRRYAEKVISLGKRAPSAASLEDLSGDELQQAQADRVTAIRRARNWVNDAEALGKVFGEYADRFRTRPGGYTRIVKMGRRDGDNAPMAVIQLVEAMSPEATPSATQAADEEETAVMPGPSEEEPAEPAELAEE